MRKRWFFGFLAVLALFFGAIIFRAKSWTELPYSPTDGMQMFGLIEEKFNEGTGWNLFSGIPVGRIAKPSPLDSLKLNLAGVKKDTGRACVGVIKFKGKMQPPFIHWINGLFHIAPNLNYTNSGVVTSSHYNANYAYSLGASSWGENPAPNGGGNDMKAIATEFAQIENNGHMKLNEDFLYIQYNENLRLYPLGQVPPKAKEVARAILGEKIQMTGSHGPDEVIKAIR